MTQLELLAYANSQFHGYLKPGKAASIIITLNDIPELLGDTHRLLDYVENCLMMEGFTADDCYDIALWILMRSRGVDI